MSALSTSTDSGTAQPTGLGYVLITPARNEAAFIEQTIRSVVSQTITPLRWVIVSDGSTDGTDEIVAGYADRYDWIQLIRMPSREARDFAGKVHAFNAGYARVRTLDYSAIGSLDADISFDPEYFAFLLAQFSRNSRLGLVGTPFEEEGESYDYRFVSIEHVSGACQFFRRECFEAVGGYVAMPGGGVDHVAVITARMNGWQTQTFTEKVCHHHRKQGSAINGALKAKFRVGALDYALGGHPLWEVFRGVYQMSKKPRIVGGCLILGGYFWSLLRKVKRPVSPELVQFRQREQIARLTRFFTGGARSVPKTNPQESPQVP